MKIYPLIALSLALSFIGAGCALDKGSVSVTEDLIVKDGNMKITSSAFEHEQLIPVKYSCDSDNINPELSISDTPEGTVSLALLMDDPDVPRNLRPDGVFDHWTVFNMPPTIESIVENTVPPGVIGLNSRGTNEYIGPCPPDKEHRYFFKLYALDIMLDLDANSSKADVEAAMKGHILEEAVLMGRYDRSR